MPRGKRLRGVGSKEQRQYEHIKKSAQLGDQRLEICDVSLCVRDVSHYA